jgi:hypothetical protein
MFLTGLSARLSNDPLAPIISAVCFAGALLCIIVSLYRSRLFEGAAKRVRLIGHTLISVVLAVILGGMWYVLWLRPSAQQSPISDELSKVLKSSERRAQLRFSGIQVAPNQKIPNMGEPLMQIDVLMKNTGERQILPAPRVTIAVALVDKVLPPLAEDEFFTGARHLWNDKKLGTLNAIEPNSTEIIPYSLPTWLYDEKANRAVPLKDGVLYLITKAVYEDDYGELYSESCWFYFPNNGFEGHKCASHNR